MQLPEKAIKEYKKIYEKEFGEKISDQDALEQATNLVNLMKIIYKPIMLLMMIIFRKY